ncbi:MAG: ABC transporter permease [Actinobacteria bacterium]|nr:ABC transporter permease [Actinomycetota bacterium]
MGLLRAVGISRRQVRSMVRGESVITSVLGAILGLTVGVLFGWALLATLSSEGISELVFPGGQLAIYVVVAAIAGVLAAVGPARRAARLDVLEAISQD